MARWLLGLLLLAMAVGQVSDLGGFVDIVETYRIGGTALAAIVALGLIAGELVAGLGLLFGRVTSPRRAAVAAVVVATGWSVLTAQAFARSLTLTNCGCFGVHLGQPLRWWILLEDVEFLALALWVWHTSRRSPTTTPTPAIVESTPDARP